MNFNETELAIFKLQSGFELGKYYESQDGTICAVDDVNHKVFIGQNLLRVNVHDLDSLQSVELEDNGTVKFCLGNPQKTLRLKFTPEDAESLYSILSETASCPADVVSDICDGPACSETPLSEEPGNYKETGQSMYGQPSGILEVARTLKFGDRIQIEYKQMFGRIRGRFAVFSHFCCRWSSRSMSVFAKGGSFEELKENLVMVLSDKISINFVCDGDVSETSRKLNRITALRKLE